MENQILKKNYTKEEILSAFASLDVHIMLNLYRRENTLFGHIKANEKMPIDRYLEDLGLQGMAKLADLQFYEDNDFEPDRIPDFEKLCFEIFRDRIDFAFTDIPIDKSFCDEDCNTEGGDIYHYKYGFYDIIKSIYPIFKEIIETEINPDLYAATPDVLDRDTRREYYLKATKFVLAIKIRSLRQGGRIDRYIKNMPFISPILMRLIRTYKKHYYLKNSDTTSLDYKLALLSCFQFMSDYNTKLFELKMLRWEENTTQSHIKTTIGDN